MHGVSKPFGGSFNKTRNIIFLIKEVFIARLLCWIALCCMDDVAIVSNPYISSQLYHISSVQRNGEIKSTRLMRHKSLAFKVRPSFQTAPRRNTRAVAVLRDSDGVCDHNDDPEDEPAFLSPSTLPLSHIYHRADPQPSCNKCSAP